MLLLAARARMNHVPAVPGMTFTDYIDTFVPVAHWRMDDAVGSTALVDRIATASAALTGTPGTTYVLARPGLLKDDMDTAVQFAGGRAATVADAKWALGNGDYSVLFLSKWTGTTLQTVVAVRDGTVPNEIAVFTIGRWTGSVEVMAQDGTTTIASATDKLYNDGAPHLLGLTVTGQTMKLYIDGALKATQTLIAARPVVGTMNVTLGANIGGNQSFAGTLDEVALFDRMLSDSDMATLASYVATS